MFLVLRIRTYRAEIGVSISLVCSPVKRPNSCHELPSAEYSRTPSANLSPEPWWRRTLVTGLTSPKSSCTQLFTGVVSVRSAFASMASVLSRPSVI